MNNHNTFQAIITLTEQGAKLASKLSQELSADMYVPQNLSSIYPEALCFQSLAGYIQVLFQDYQGLIFIAATGLVVRIIAPYLKGKDIDPAIVVLDQYGQYVISLVSGHMGGANQLAKEIARITKGQAVITTASDNLGIKGIDTLALEQGLKIYNKSALKMINSALLKGARIQLYDPWSILKIEQSNSYHNIYEFKQLTHNQPGVLVEFRKISSFDPKYHLRLLPKRLIVGIGCNTNTSSQEILELIKDTFDQYQLDLNCLKCLTSTSLKSEETGLRQAAKELGLPFRLVEHESLKEILVPSPSQKVLKYMGVNSICEASAIVQAQHGSLLVPKTKSKNATLAVALDI